MLYATILAVRVFVNMRTSDTRKYALMMTHMKTWNLIGSSLQIAYTLGSHVHRQIPSVVTDNTNSHNQTPSRVSSPVYRGHNLYVYTLST